MQTGGRLVEDIKRPAGRGPAELGRQLDSLGFASRKRAARLTEGQISQPHVVKGIKSAQDARHRLKEPAALVDSHLEDIADRLSLEFHFERLAVESLASAYVACDMQIRKEVHRQPALAEAPAGLAAAAPWR